MDEPNQRISLLAFINLVAFLGSMLFAVLVSNDYPIDAAEAVRHSHTSRLLVVVGMFFWVAFCVTVRRK